MAGRDRDRDCDASGGEQKRNATLDSTRESTERRLTYIASDDENARSRSILIENQLINKACHERMGQYVYV